MMRKWSERGLDLFKFIKKNNEIHASVTCGRGSEVSGLTWTIHPCVCHGVCAGLVSVAMCGLGGVRECVTYGPDCDRKPQACIELFINTHFLLYTQTSSIFQWHTGGISASNAAPVYTHIQYILLSKVSQTGKLLQAPLHRHTVLFCGYERASCVQTLGTCRKINSGLEEKPLCHSLLTEFITPSLRTARL